MTTSHSDAPRLAEDGDPTRPRGDAPVDEHPPSPRPEPGGGGRARRRVLWPGPLHAFALTGLFLIALFFTLYFAASLFIPIVVAALFYFVFSPVVRFLKRCVRLPEPIGALLVVLALTGGGGWTLYTLSGPAAEWMAEAPDVLRHVASKLRPVRESVEGVQRAAAQAEQLTDMEGGADRPIAVRVRGRSLADTFLSHTRAFIAGTVIVVILLFFLLASGDRFLGRLVAALPGVGDRGRAVAVARRIERDISMYLLTITATNLSLGIAVAGALHLVGLPNPLLWGAVAAAAEYIPYLGATVTTFIIAAVSLLTFDGVGEALVAPAVYVALANLNGNFVVPYVVGRRLRLNPVIVFVSLLFWGWMWGVIGALLAVPILVVLKIACDHSRSLARLGIFIGR